MNTFTFYYSSMSLLLGGFTSLILGITVYIQNKNNSVNRIWLYLTITTAVWSFGYFLMIYTTNKVFATYYDWVLHFAAILIPGFYLLLVLKITNTFEKYIKLRRLVLLLVIFFTLITPTHLFLLPEISKVGFNFAPVPGPLYIIFFCYFLLTIICGILILLRSIKSCSEYVQKIRLSYILLFSSVAAIGGGSVFLTTFFKSIPPYTLILFSIYPTISGYAIFKHQLFNVKVVTIQSLAFGLWSLILIKISLTTNVYEQIINIIMLLVIICFDLVLIKRSISESIAREKIEQLALTLERTNLKLRELDQRKSEFVSLASHQLRGPLTILQGYSDLIFKGSLGEIPPPVKQAVKKMREATDAMTTLVGDYLDISRIEQDSMEYVFSFFNLQELIKDILFSLRFGIQKSKLETSFIYDDAHEYIIHADQGKIRQVILNLLENSIKYTPRGTIRINLEKNLVSNKITVSILDSGIGININMMCRLFEKFSRSPETTKAHISGTGLGLYVAKKMIEAHNGRIWAESEGEGKGSTFYIELNGS